MHRRPLPSSVSRRRRRVGEAGFALPTVLFVMLGAFAIGSVAAIASIGAQKGTTRDHNTKTAIAAAEAGVSQALLRYNRVRSAGVTSGCLVVGDAGMSEQQPPDESNGWCSSVEGQTSGGGEFTYWVRPTENQIEVVSQGFADAVTRRVELIAISKPQPVNPFADATLIGLLGIDLANNAHVEANVATNGQIGLGNSATLDCAVAQVGQEHLSEPFDPNEGTATCAPTAGEPIRLPPVNQGDAPIHNSNWRFFEWDPISGNRGDVDWDPDTRELTLHQNSAVTLGGSNYSLCKLTMRNRTTLYIAADATVNIFFDSPEECAYGDGETQLQMEPNSAIKPNGGASVALLFVGSESDPPLSTNIVLRSNTHQNSTCSQSFVIYAPLTDIAMSGNAQYCGAMGGLSIDMENNPAMTPSNLAQEFTLPNEDMWSPYWRDRFVECSGPAPEPPNQPNHGC